MFVLKHLIHCDALDKNYINRSKRQIEEKIFVLKTSKNAIKKSVQRFSIDISPKKTHRWPTDT